jgi:hypothetical protein
MDGKARTGRLDVERFDGALMFDDAGEQGSSRFGVR